MPDTPTQSTACEARWYSPQGRAGRWEFWCWAVGLIPLCIVGVFLLTAGLILPVLWYCNSGAEAAPAAAGIIAGSVVIISLFPFFMMLCRRLRDAGLNPLLSLLIWGILAVSTGLWVYAGFHLSRRILAEAQPVAERYDTAVAASYQRKDIAERKRLKEAEKQELRALVYREFNRESEDNKTFFTMLNFLSLACGCCVLVLPIIGFLPPQRQISEQNNPTES